MGSLGGPDVWKISADERSKHDQQFFSLKPVNGMISGEQARGYFLQSGLPSAVLAQIWNLADINKDGKMDKKEFSIAVHLIQKKLQGFSLPQTLPDTMKMDPTPVIGTFGTPSFPIPPQATAAPGWSSVPPVAPSPVPYGSPPTSFVGGYPSQVPSSSPVTVRSKVDWALPHNSKLKYSQTFNNIDKNRTGFLSGVHARNVLSQYGLPNTVLAQIWTFSDLDKDGRLSCDEFCLAMHLIDMVKIGETLPMTLPPEATAFMRQRNTSVGNASMVQSSMVNSSVEELSQAVSGGTSFASFEDKRKQNFDKGQAELERRRQILFEQEKRERDERERKEREEFEKQERERLELERRRQLEMEKQMAKQREEQQKREEEYRKVIEQREAARRELEKQRQVELERQRIHELMLLRQQEQEIVCHVKQKEKNLNFQLQALNEKSNDLNNLITEVREKIVGITSSIEGMKRDRDTKLLDIENSKRQMQEINMNSAHLMHERQMLQDRRMNVAGGPANQISDSYTQVMHTYRNKSQNLESLRQSLADIERNLEIKTTTSKERQHQLMELKMLVENETKENNALTQKIITCQQAVRKLAPHHAVQQNQNQAWAPSFDADGGAGPVTDNNWPSESVNGDATVKYRAVYEFAARSEDELSFQPGDVILVFKNHVGEPGWLAGQIKDKVGWFPEAFAECLDTAGTPDQGGSDLAATSKPVSISKLDSINEESFESAHAGTVRAASEGLEQPKNGVKSTEIKKAVAHFQFKAKKDNHLAFNKGDVITILEMQEMWWMGELDGKSGWFPKSYVKLMDGERRKSETTPSLSFPKPTTSVSQEFPSQSPPKPGAGGKWFIACYPFPEMEKGDLQFESGDRIFVTQQEGEWWTGQCGGREGMFPANYVQPIAEESPTTSDSLVKSYEYSMVQKQKTPTEPTPYKQPSIEVTTPTEEPHEFEIGKVIAPYKAVEANQLTLDTGDLIKIRSKSPTGWWEGELQKKGQDKKIGWFPGNYIQILGKPPSSKESSVDKDLGKSASSTSDDKKKETVMAMFDYVAQQDDELSLNRGDILIVLEKIDADWWRGEMANGQQGLFPVNYIQPYTGTDRLPETHDQQHSTKTPSGPSTPTTGGVENNASEMKNGTNNKRSMYCQELLYTEQNYFDDLHMVKEVFYKQLAASNVLTSEELRALFINWDDLSRVSKGFAKSLKQYGEDRIGRAVLQSLNELRAFVTFCQFQQSSLEFLESKSKTSTQFQAVHSQCCQHPAARGLPLSHFLLIPMTRVTKYPLVLKEILKYTPDDHPDRESLEKALTALKDLCDEVNRVATETENLQMLYWCQNHVKCEAIQPKFVFHSATNFLGPRKFVHFGVLYKAKSNRLLIGLLFNDVLMLTTPDEAIDHPDSFKLNRTSELVLSLYKQPILLHKSSLQMPPSLTGVENGDDTLFALNNGEILISFKAVSSNGRLLWQKQLEKAIKHAKLEYFKFQTSLSSPNPPQSTSHPKTGIGRLLIEIVVLRNLNTPVDCKNLPILVELSFGDQKTTKTVDLNKTEPPLCTTQFVISESKSGIFSMSVFVERLYQPNLCLGKAELPLLDMMKMSGLQKNPAMKQLPLINQTADGEELSTQQVIIKFVVQMFDGQ